MDVTPIKVPQGLALVLNSAGDKSDVDFNYLVATAQRESSLNPSAKAPSSSAVGLFQFLDSTWLQVMKQEGPRLGYQSYADAITVDKDGDYVIRDKALRTEVLKLREDPQVAADMAAAFTRANGEYLQGKFGRMPSPGELYIAHFLGPQGAEKMFRAGLDNPDQVAATLFPKQAKANPQIFYDHGHARTIREVYKALVAKHNDTQVAVPPAADVQVAAVAPAPDAVDPVFAAQQMSGIDARGWSDAALPSRISRDDMSFGQLFSTEPGGAPKGPLVANTVAAPLAAAAASGQTAVPAPGASAPMLSAFAPQTETAGDDAPSLTAIADATTPSGVSPLLALTAGTGVASAMPAFRPLPTPPPLTVESMRPQPVQVTVTGGAPELDGRQVAATESALAPMDLGLPPLGEDAAPAISVAPDMADAGVPQPRILMTPRSEVRGASPFFTQLLSGSGS